MYLPANLAIKRLGLKIRDHYFPLSRMPDPDADSFKGWLDKRVTLETLLQLNVTPSQHDEPAARARRPAPRCARQAFRRTAGGICAIE